MTRILYYIVEDQIMNCNDTVIRNDRLDVSSATRPSWRGEALKSYVYRAHNEVKQPFVTIIILTAVGLYTLMESVHFQIK